MIISWNHLHPFQKGMFLTCSDHVLQLSYFFQRQIYWNQLNKKKIIPGCMEHFTSTHHAWVKFLSNSATCTINIPYSLHGMVMVTTISHIRLKFVSNIGTCKHTIHTLHGKRNQNKSLISKIYVQYR